MWFLNNKTIILDLEKLSYKRWEEVKWIIKFDFWEEIIKADRISVWLNRKMKSNNLNLSKWVNSSSQTQYNFLLDTSLLGKWEYKKEEIPFNFIIPQNAIMNEISFSKLLEKIPESFRSIAEIIIDMIVPNMRRSYSFEIVARIDIPWAIDITETVEIAILQD